MVEQRQTGMDNCKNGRGNLIADESGKGINKDTPKTSGAGTGCGRLITFISGLILILKIQRSCCQM